MAAAASQVSVEKLPRALIGDDTHTRLSHYHFTEVATGGTAFLTFVSASSCIEEMELCAIFCCLPYYCLP